VVATETVALFDEQGRGLGGCGEVGQQWIGEMSLRQSGDERLDVTVESHADAGKGDPPQL
jgi:hypothetical protein